MPFRGNADCLTFPKQSATDTAQKIPRQSDQTMPGEVSCSRGSYELARRERPWKLCRFGVGLLWFVIHQSFAHQPLKRVLRGLGADVAKVGE